MSLEFLKSYESMSLEFLKSYESMSLEFLKYTYKSCESKNNSAKLHALTDNSCVNGHLSLKASYKTVF
jgi:hypothetical protein